MRLKIGEDIVVFDDETLDYMYVDEGAEAEVFKYGEEALKIYKSLCYKERLGEEDSIKLSQIKTERFLMPGKMIYDLDNNKFKGYSLPFIHKYSPNVISHLSMRHLLSEFDVLVSDICLLSDNGVCIDDLHIDNTLYNGSFFICDPGSFGFSNNNFSDIYRDNIINLNRFLLDEILSQVKITKKKRSEFNYKFDEYYYLGTQMREFVSSDDETVKQYIKKMIK